jgi:hypothetical protein
METGEKEVRKELAPKTYSMSVGDRVVILHMLPQKASYEVMKASKGISELLWFNVEERKQLNLRQVKDDNGFPFFMWDENNIGNIDVELDGLQQELIGGWLKALDREDQIGKEHFELYEKFFIGK